jgi:hypothetical protein
MATRKSRVPPTSRANAAAGQTGRTSLPTHGEPEVSEKTLDEIMSERDEAPEHVEQAATAEPVNEQPRNPAGKFAAKADKAEEPSEPTDKDATAAVEGTEPTADKPHGQVPLPALHAEREKARAERERADDLARQLAEIRGQVSVLTQQRQPAQPVEQPKAPEIWDDPEVWAEHKLSQKLSPLQEQLAETTFYYSQRTAIAEHGQEAVAAAETALKEAISRGELNAEQVTAQMRRSRDPVGDVVSWHKNLPAVREQSLREQIRAELMAELGTHPANPAAPTPTVAPPAAKPTMPSNFASARSEGPRTGVTYSGPKPLSEITMGSPQ